MPFDLGAGDKLSDAQRKQLRVAASTGDAEAQAECVRYGLANSKTHGPQYREFIRAVATKKMNSALAPALESDQMDVFNMWIKELHTHALV